MKTKSSSKTICVLLILISLFFAFISIDITNSYFTSGKGLDLHTTVYINNLNLKVFQVVGEQRNELISQEELKGGAPTYIKLNSQEILPDEEYELNLVVKNEETSKNSLYIRYKIEFLAVGYLADIPINATVKTDSCFVQNGGWYYYTLNGENATIESNKEANLISSFCIPYSEFVKENFNANTIKIVLTIEGYLTNGFN